MENDTCWPIVLFKKVTMGKVEFEDPVDRDTKEVKYRRLKVLFDVDCEVEAARRLGNDFYTAIYDVDGSTLRKGIANLKSKTQLFQVNRITISDPEGRLQDFSVECWIQSSVKVDMPSPDANPRITLQVHIPRDHEALCKIDDYKRRPEMSLNLVRSEYIEESRKSQKSVRDRLSDCSSPSTPLASQRSATTSIIPASAISFETFGKVGPETEALPVGGEEDAPGEAV